MTTDTAAAQRSVSPWVGFSFVMATTVFGAVLIALPNAALSEIEQDLGLTASGGELSWTLAFAAISAFMAPAGQFSDRIGRYRVFLIGSIAAGLLAILSGLVQNGDVFLLVRPAQGASLAVMFAPATGIVNTIFPDARRRAIAFGIFGLAFGIGLGLGPIMGAVFPEWRAGFFVTAACVLFATAGAWFTAEFDAGNPERGIDIGGGVLMVFALSLLIVGFDQGGTWGWLETNTVPVLFGWDWPFSISIVAVMLALSLVFFVALYFYERRLYDRGGAVLIDPDFFHIPSYTLGLIAACALFFAMLPLFVIIPMISQILLGQDALGMAITTAPVGLGAALGGLLSIPVGSRIGAKWTVVFGMFAAAATSLILIPIIDVDMTDAALAIAIFPLGLATGLVYAKVTALTLEDVPVEASAHASGLMFSGRSTSGAFGSLALIAIITVVVTHSAPLASEAAQAEAKAEALALVNAGANAQTHSTSSGTSGKSAAEVVATNEIVKAQGEAYVDGFRAAIGVAAAVFVFGGLVATTVPRRHDEEEAGT